jgi:hypothetical protein
MTGTRVIHSTFFFISKRKMYKGNTLFQYVEGCYEYNCNCRCDGGWSCPANRTRDTCRLNMATGCYFCNVNDEKFEGSISSSHYRCTHNQTSNSLVVFQIVCSLLHAGRKHHSNYTRLCYFVHRYL